jgi:two-component system chemotaxis response regulator CheY
MVKRILVVDDSVDTCELLHLHLTDAGFDVSVAVEGSEAIRLAGSYKPDLIITDISMPDMDGIHLIRQLRTMPEFAASPIIAFTALDQGIADEARSAGANSVFHKPMRYQSLIEEVKKLLLLLLAAGLCRV